jgi:hypothetical protein
MQKYYNIRQAADYTGKSEVTIRKYLGLQGKPTRLPNAYKTETLNGYFWQIPEMDLINSGLKTTQAQAFNKDADVQQLLAKIEQQEKIIEKLLEIITKQ